MAELILNINLEESGKKNRLVLETYEGAIPRLKSRQFSGPLRSVNINGVIAADNLSSLDLELARNYLNKQTNIQISKHQYILASSGLSELERFVKLRCLFYRNRKMPMFQVEEIILCDEGMGKGLQLEGLSVWGEKTLLFFAVGNRAKVDALHSVVAKAYVNIKEKDHPLCLLFDYDNYAVKHGSSNREIPTGLGYRDYDYEKKTLSVLKSHGWSQHGDTDFVYIGRSFESDLLALVDQGIAVFTRAQKRVLRGDFSAIQVSFNIDWFDIEGNVWVDDTEVDIAGLIDLRRSGESWVELNGSIVFIPEALRSNSLRSLKETGGLKLAKNRVVEAIELAYELNGDTVDDLDRLNDHCSVTLDIDKGIMDILRPYQEVGVRWLLSLRKNGFGGCLADDMGLGKTLQIIAYLSDSSMDGAINLVVVPKTLLVNWEREFHRFSPKTSVYLYHGANRCLLDALRSKVVITTYGTLLNDIDSFGSLNFNNLIVDEAQYIKNPRSKKYRTVKSVNAETKIILTGTPIENNIQEYWGLMKLVNQNIMTKASPFRKGVSNEAAIEKVRRITSPFLLRRMKKEVLTDLPEKREQTIYCKMEASQQHLYNTLLESIRHELSRKKTRFEIKTSAIMLSGLLYLQEVCCHPLLLDEHLNPNRCSESVKLDLLMDMLDSLHGSGHKVVVFSRFARMLKIIETQMVRQHYNYFYIDGSTEGRINVVDEFEKSENGIFLISLKAGGTGLNLVSADTVVLYDPWWNPAAEKQAEDRVFRIGQKRDVMVYRLIVEGTVEEKVQALQNNKKELYEKILDGHETPTSLNAEEMRRLLYD